MLVKGAAGNSLYIVMGLSAIGMLFLLGTAKKNNGFLTSTVLILIAAYVCTYLQKEKALLSYFFPEVMIFALVLFVIFLAAFGYLKVLRETRKHVPLVIWLFNLLTSLAGAFYFTCIYLGKNMPVLFGINFPLTLQAMPSVLLTIIAASMLLYAFFLYRLYPEESPEPLTYFFR